MGHQWNANIPVRNVTSKRWRIDIDLVISMSFRHHFHVETNLISQLDGVLFGSLCAVLSRVNTTNEIESQTILSGCFIKLIEQDRLLRASDEVLEHCVVGSVQASIEQLLLVVR